jgi:hypothetical protein
MTNIINGVKNEQKEEKEDDDDYPILSPPYDIDSCQSEIDRLIEYLNNKRNAISDLVDGPHGYKPIKSLSFMVTKAMYANISSQNETLFETVNFYQITIDILAYLVKKLDEIDFKTSAPNPDWPNKLGAEPSVNERRIYILCDLLKVNYYSFFVMDTWKIFTVVL